MGLTTRKLFRVLAACSLSALFAWKSGLLNPWDKITSQTPLATATLNLTDTFGETVKGPVSVTLCHQALDTCRSFNLSASQARNFTIPDLPANLNNPYRLLAKSPLYKSEKIDFKLKKGDENVIAVRLIAPPESIRSVSFPDFNNLPVRWQNLMLHSPYIEGYEGLTGRQLYDRMDVVQKATLLNILAKSDRTLLFNGSAMLEHVTAIRSIHDDRVLVESRVDMKGQLRDSADYDLFNARGNFKSMMHDPPPGYKKTGNFKSRDKTGNIDITIYKNHTSNLLEIDIDEYTGVRHSLEVTRNELRGVPTNPFQIAQILSRDQGIDPLYRLNLLARNNPR